MGQRMVMAASMERLDAAGEMDMVENVDVQCGKQVTE